MKFINIIFPYFELTLYSEKSGDYFYIDGFHDFYGNHALC